MKSIWFSISLLFVTTLGFAQTEPDLGREYVILNKHSEIGLDAQKLSSRTLAPLYQWHYMQKGTQHFKFIPGDSGHYRIVTEHFSYLSASSKVPGGEVIQGTTRNLSFQQWRLEWADSIYFRIVNKATGMCMDVADASTKSRAPIILNNKMRKSSQFWRLYPKQELNLVEEGGVISKIEHLSGNVNSMYDEVSPVISPDGKTLIFNRKEMPVENGYGKDDIFISTLRDDGTWTSAERVSQPLNNPYNNFACSITPDGNTLLLGNVYKDGKCYRGTSISQKTNNGWSYPVAQKIIDYKNNVRWAGYYLSNDQQVLLLSIATDYCYGMTDLYVSFKSGDTAWTAPMNLGATINTPVSENTPFLAADGKTLYFASEGHGGYGYSDIFVSKRLDDSWTNWSKPQNIGKPFNTPNWDAYFTIPASGEYAYFVSQQQSFGKQDIYRYPLSEKLKPEPVLLIYGQVKNKISGAAISAKISFKELENNSNAGIANTDSSGNYKIVLPAGKNYEIIAIKESFAAESGYKTTKIESYGEVEVNLSMIPIEANAKYVLNNLFFHVDHPEVMQSSYPELDRLHQMMADHPKLVIEVGGHTDNTGTDAYNENLSAMRAKAVAAYLLKKGIENDRIQTHGYGESVPAATNDTEEGRAQNRRVEVKFLKVD